MTYELAIDVNGEPFDVPPEVVAWRIRRMRTGGGPGRPGLVFDELGKARTVPVDATHQDLYDVAGAGSYRLDPIDEAGHDCKDVLRGVTGMIQPQDDSEHVSPSRTSPRNTSPATSDDEGLVGLVMAQLLHVVQVNTRITEMVITKLPAVLDAAGGLINAADGAKLTTREPVPLLQLHEGGEGDEDEDDDSDEDDDIDEDDDSENAAPAPESRLPAWMQVAIREISRAAVDKVVDSVSGGLPLAALFDWSKAAPSSSSPPVSSPPSPRHDAPAPRRPAAPPYPGDHAWDDPTPAPVAPGAWPSMPPHIVAIPPYTAGVEPRVIVPVATGSTMPVQSAALPVVEMDAASMPIVVVSGVPTVAESPVLAAPVPSAPMPSAMMPSAPAATPGTSDASSSPHTTPGAPPAPAPEPMPRTAGALPGGPEPTAPDAPSAAPTVAQLPGNHAHAVGQAPPARATQEIDSGAVAQHVSQVYAQLGAKEQRKVQQIAAALTPEERMQWLFELATLSVPDAVARVRHIIRPPDGGSNGAAP